ncbi:unnamed protein product [Urochloa humidicola]
MYGGAADIRSYSASYARPAAAHPPASSRVKRARSVSSWTRPASAAVRRSGSAKSVAGGGGRPGQGLNLRSYSASYAASYGPTIAADGGGAGQLKRSGSVTNCSSANRRSVNLRGYTPSFAALHDTAAAAAPAPAPEKKAAALDDAELQRRKRLVVYKTYDVEGKVRESMRRGVSWIKGKCSRVVYAWW